MVEARHHLALEHRPSRPSGRPACPCGVGRPSETDLEPVVVAVLPRPRGRRGAGSRCRRDPSATRRSDEENSIARVTRTDGSGERRSSGIGSGAERRRRPSSVRSSPRTTPRISTSEAGTSMGRSDGLAGSSTTRAPLAVGTASGSPRPAPAPRRSRRSAPRSGARRRRGPRRGSARRSSTRPGRAARRSRPRRRTISLGTVMRSSSSIGLDRQRRPRPCRAAAARPRRRRPPRPARGSASGSRPSAGSPCPTRCWTCLWTVATEESPKWAPISSRLGE